MAPEPAAATLALRPHPHRNSSMSTAIPRAREGACQLVIGDMEGETREREAHKLPFTATRSRSHRRPSRTFSSAVMPPGASASARRIARRRARPTMATHRPPCRPAAHEHPPPVPRCPHTTTTATHRPPRRPAAHSHHDERDVSWLWVVPGRGRHGQDPRRQWGQDKGLELARAGLELVALALDGVVHGVRKGSLSSSRWRSTAFEPLHLWLLIDLSHRPFAGSRPRAAFSLPRTSSILSRIRCPPVRARPFFRLWARRRPPSMEADLLIACLQRPALRLPRQTLRSMVRDRRVHPARCASQCSRTSQQSLFPTMAPRRVRTEHRNISRDALLRIETATATAIGILATIVDSEEGRNRVVKMSVF
ncbi:hypothetical protein BJ912DRAFT_565672 [Pholiota molesta]|nr:hypothetical protein BJ912DRAFT_565672 [Pholiota molesta]